MTAEIALDRMARIGSWHDGDGGPLMQLVVRVKVVTLQHDRPQLTVEHEPIVRYERLTIVGDVLEGRRFVGGGQVADELDRITRPAPGWGPDERARLQAIWRRWHLNDLRAACAHQTPPPSLDDPWPDPCPETGYRFGSAWLVEPLPGEVTAWLSGQFDSEPGR